MVKMLLKVMLVGSVGLPIAGCNTTKKNVIADNTSEVSQVANGNYAKRPLPSYLGNASKRFVQFVLGESTSTLENGNGWNLVTAYYLYNKPYYDRVTDPKALKVFEEVKAEMKSNIDTVQIGSPRQLDGVRTIACFGAVNKPTDEKGFTVLEVPSVRMTEGVDKVRNFVHLTLVKNGRIDKSVGIRNAGFVTTKSMFNLEQSVMGSYATENDLKYGYDLFFEHGGVKMHYSGETKLLRKDYVEKGTYRIEYCKTGVFIDDDNTQSPPYKN